LLFLSEFGEQRKVDINCFARLTPALKGDAAYEAKLLALRLAKVLQLIGSLKPYSRPAAFL